MRLLQPVALETLEIAGSDVTILYGAVQNLNIFCYIVQAKLELNPIEDRRGPKSTSPLLPHTSFSLVTSKT